MCVLMFTHVGTLPADFDTDLTHVWVNVFVFLCICASTFSALLKLPVRHRKCRNSWDGGRAMGWGMVCIFLHKKSKVLFLNYLYFLSTNYRFKCSVCVFVCPTKRKFLEHFYIPRSLIFFFFFLSSFLSFCVLIFF